MTGEAKDALDRRHFLLRMGAAGGAAAMLGCDAAPRDEDVAAAAAEGGDPAPWVKDPARFIRHPTNLETRLEEMQGFLTPTDLFFVRNHAPTPRVDAATWRLTVEGRSIARPLTLTLDEIRTMPSRTVVAFVECGGNWRGFSQELTGQTASGGPWATGAVGNAEWTGVSLRQVLERAGLRGDAVDVNLHGVDDGAFNRPMPVAKALDEDTILAWAMNGEELPPDHGFPLRAVVPGWVGSNSIKWLGRIEASPEPIHVSSNTSSYVLIGDAWPPEGDALGHPVYEQSVKSALAIPRPATLPAGLQRLRGYAHGARPIAKVTWSADGGGSWRDARLLEPAMRWAWRRFELAWDATPGRHVLMTRATDDRGETQPMPPMPHNEKGYLLNGVVGFPVEVV